MKYRIQLDIPCDETALQKTIDVSKAAFVAGEAEQTLSSAEFLYQGANYGYKADRIRSGRHLS